MIALARAFIVALGVAAVAACTGAGSVATEPGADISSTEAASSQCVQTEPAWVKPPEDAAVQNEPAFGHYYVNADQSIWASAWWAGPRHGPVRVNKNGIKVGWFRPAGEPLIVSGQRLDAPAPPLESHVPCCYPTRFQATGLVFPTAGCWQVNARAGDRELSFTVHVAP